MTEKTKVITRREFLKTSGKIAGAVILTGLSAACISDARKRKEGDSENESPSEGRGDYKVFSPGHIGTMSVKNRLIRSATMIAAASEGRPTEEYIQMYSELARGGVAVIITGFMIPTRADASYTSRCTPLWAVPQKQQRSWWLNATTGS